MRVDIKDHQWENALIVYQILPADFISYFSTATSKEIENFIICLI